MTKFSVLALALVAASAAATPATELQAKLDVNPAFSATFQQTVTDANNKVIQSGTGTLALAQPNRFYWHLAEPDESLIVADGQDVWIYNPFAEEATVLTLDQAIATSPMTLLVHRDAASWQQFDITEKSGCFTIAPKATDSGVQQVSVCFNGQQLTEISLNDNQSNISRFRLTEQHAIAADDGLFNFVAPEGISIDDQRHGAQ
ncbi:outer membrane lipoprotein chaperone LolA [Shewanella avicenniae]|uniref:Outer-membrane lipoprotein carrier protein n=1 Tax=Shewanella avicenniae TaxID=2814294 RepID=A0ABX7QUW8_9GAMM|nr:outer membrane lipoprotein chaperone LolA [Shewanella avicenniae]QSX35277.1 outer membrane lipoprotein chaperone LolA [Shewanella avicenniae]